MRYQNAYVWLILFAVLDVLLTYLVLYGWGGSEANPVAARVIATRGIRGALWFKLALILFVIVLCEVIGRRSDTRGRSLSRLAVLLAAFPVVYTFTLLFSVVHGPLLTQ
ncbi:MAG TPA: DUF5658 family protein [Phycisphaerae bacterium]|nr:DUF5658 family protein [Phycisphaerae bacterium]HNU43918.1 DUF5658 family protein [Phycisphaerae bacterium]